MTDTKHISDAINGLPDELLLELREESEKRCHTFQYVGDKHVTYEKGFMDGAKFALKLQQALWRKQFIDDVEEALATHGGNDD